MSNPPKIPTDIFEGVCRVCAKKSSKMISLFGIRKKGLILAEILAICSQNDIRQTDFRPSNICGQCLSNLEIAFDFYSLVKSSEQRFQNMIVSYNSEPHKMQPIEFCPLADDDNCSFIQKQVKVELKEENIEYRSNQQHQSEQKRKRRSSPCDDANESPRMNLDSHHHHLHQQEMQHNRRMNRLFECFLCKAKLKSYKDTRIHLKRHNEATPFKCKICAMNFSAVQFERHLCRGQSIQCAYCAESFQTTKSLLEHLDGHREQHKLHKCTDCSKLFPMQYLLECHQTQHKTVEKPHICHICNRGFRVNFLLSKHLATHSDERRMLQFDSFYTAFATFCGNILII